MTLIGPAAAPALTLDKSSTTTTYATVGQVVPYSYRVTNTGNVTISALTVTDDRIATVSCPATTLAPTASTTCSGSYTITQADLDAGSVTNNASAAGTPARGTLAPATDSVTVTATELPALALTKTAVSGDPYDEVGAVVNYQYVVTNTGNVTISALTVTDDRIATRVLPADDAGARSKHAVHGELHHHPGRPGRRFRHQQRHGEWHARARHADTRHCQRDRHCDGTAGVDAGQELPWRAIRTTLRATWSTTSTS